MLIRIGIENGFQGRSQAWALDYPGAFAYGLDSGEAIMNLPQALIHYQHWVNHHAGFERVQLGDFDLRLADTWDVYTLSKDFNPDPQGVPINAWFHDDWRPLSAEDVSDGLDLLGYSRQDLLAIVQGLPAEKLDQAYSEERWSIRGILAHIATAEWWYLDRFGQGGPRADLPKDPYERLEFTRARLRALLSGLVDVEQVLGKEGEFWSPRKLLRRVLWHEMDHIQHITKLL